MALALESLTFSVETKELENAIQKIKELGQAASSLNKPIEQLGKQASESAKKVEQAASSSKKLEQANNKAASATDTLTAATTRAERSNTKQVSGVDKLQNLLNKLGNTYSDVSNGLTRGESNVLNTARSYGALESQLEPVKKLLEQIKGLTKDPFDSAIGSVRRITQEFEALKQRADLANSGIFLTTKQLQEYSKIANEVKGKIISSGIKETDAAFMSKYNALLQATQEEYKQTAKNVNNWQAEEKLHNEELKRQEQTLIKNATAMDDVAMRWKSMQAQYADKAAAEALKEQNRLLEQGAVAMDVAVQKWKALQIAKQEKEANEQLKEQNRLQQQGLAMMDNAVEKYKALQIAKTDQEANKQLVEQERLLKQNATAMDAVVNRWKQMQAQKADQEANKQLAEQNRLMQQGLTMMDSAVQKWKASQIAKEQEQLNEQLREQNRLQQQGATAMDSAVIEFYNRKHQALQDLVKAEQFLATQEEKLQFVTAKTAEGFTVASANALYRYEQSLKKAGVTEQEFISRSSAYATALKARQDVSDTNARRKAATEELIRIEKQLEDQEKFVAYATAEYNKQQQQATHGTQAFSDTLNTSMLRSLFAYEQALRRTGAAEVDVAAKSAIMRKQLLQMQQSMQSFNGSVNHLGRNIAVQFTDIFVSLYNGQPVMQVITQQGGQIADAFLMAGESGAKMSQHLVDGLKTITEAYKMLAVAVLGFAGAGLEKFFSIFDNGLANISRSIDKTTADSERFGLVMQGLSEMAGSALRANLILIGVAVAAMAVELLKADFAVDKLNKTLIQYGASLGITAQQGEALAMQVGEATTASIGSAREAILAFAKEGVEVTAEAVAKAVELNDYLGISFEDSAKKAAQFKKEPVEALIEMAKKTGEVDIETLKYIGSLELAGDRQAAIKLAIEAKDRAEMAAIDRAKVGLSGLSALWLVIKKSITDAGDEMVVFLTTSKTLRTIYAGVGLIITTLLQGTAQIYEGWRAIFSVLAAAATGSIDNINASLAESARRMTGVNNDVMKLHEELYKFANADAEANDEAAKAAAKRREEDAKAAARFEKELALRQQLARDAGKADADKLSKQAYINASIAEEMRLLGFVTKDQELLNALTKKYGEEWDKANKSRAKPKTSFSTNTGNELQEVKRQYEQELQLEQKLQSDKLAVMKNYHDNGYMQTSVYLSREEQLVIASRNRQLDIIEKYNRDELAAFEARKKALESKASEAISAGGNSAAINKQLAQNLEDLKRQRETFEQSISGKAEKVWSASLKELSKNMDDVVAVGAGAIKVASEYGTEIEKQRANRKADIDFMTESINLSEKEIQVLKAKTEAEKQYNSVISKLEKGVEDTGRLLFEFYNNLDMTDDGAIETSMDRGWQLYVQYEKSKESLTKARILGEQEQRQAMSDAALAYDLANYKKLKDGIADAISTALFEGGKEGKKKLRDIIVAELSKPITLQINAFVNAVLSDVIGQPGNASSGQGANSDILGAFNSAYKLINNSISASITKGFTSFATSDVGIKMGLGTSNTSAVGPVKPGLTNTGTAVSSALNMAGNAYAGYSLQKSISSGYKTGESELVDAATVIASAIYGPLAGATAGVFNRAFGRKLKDQGLEGTFGGADGFDGNSYEFYKGGWFRSDKTKRKALDAGVEDALETQFKALQTQTAMMAQTLGLSADSVADFTAKIKVSFKGLNEEQINQRMAEEFGKVAESMANVALGTTEYTRTGETAAETLSRLSGNLVTVNGTFDVLGRTLYSSTLAGADMASQLVDSMGGQEAFVKATSAYYDSFYTEAERTETATRQLTEALKSIGVNTLPGTKDAFRDLVEAQDLTTASGREMFTSLIALAPAFDSIVDSVESVEQAYARLRAVNLSNEEIAQQRIDLEERLFNARATEEQIANKAREAIDAHNKALYDEVIAAEKAKAIADERLGLETQLLQLLGDTASLRALELAKLDQTNRSLQENIWLLEDSKAATDSALEQVKKIADAQIAELENSFKATDDALSKLQRSIDFQREEINKQLESANEAQSALTAIFDLLSNAISELLGEVKTETGNLLYKQAREIIASALGTGTLPSQDFLAKAVSAASSGLSELNFATKTDRDRAYIGLANELEALNSLQEPQTSAAEQQVKLLKDQLAVLDSQSEQAIQTVNALRGIDESVVDVDIAINELKQAVATEESARLQIAAIQEQVKSAQMQYDVLRGIDNSVKSVEDAVRDLLAAIEAEIEAEIEASKTTTPVKSPDVSTITTTQGAVDAGYITSSVSSSGSYTGIGDSGYRIETTSSGATLYFPGGGSHSVQGSDAASILSSTYGLTSGGLNGTLIRTRAEGGYTPSGLTLVGEEGPELVNFKAPGMVYTAAQSANLMRGDNTELVSELQALRKEVAMLRAEARATAVNTSKTARILDDVTQGGDTIKTEVAV